MLIIIMNIVCNTHIWHIFHHYCKITNSQTSHSQTRPCCLASYWQSRPQQTWRHKTERSCTASNRTWLSSYWSCWWCVKRLFFKVLSSFFLNVLLNIFIYTCHYICHMCHLYYVHKWISIFFMSILRSRLVHEESLTPELVGLSDVLANWKILDKIGIRKAVSLISLTGGQGFPKCMCKGTCRTGSCGCKRRKMVCNSRCHPTHTCENCDTHPSNHDVILPVDSDDYDSDYVNNIWIFCA